MKLAIATCREQKVHNMQLCNTYILRKTMLHRIIIVWLLIESVPSKWESLNAGVG